MKCNIGHIALSFIADNLKIHERTDYCHQSTKFITSCYYIFIPRWITKRKREIVWINTGVKKRRGFHGYKAEKVTTTTTQSESMHMQDGEEPDLSLSAVGKTEKEFVVEDVENLKTNNKIVPITVNSNSSQGPIIHGVVHVK